MGLRSKKQRSGGAAAQGNLSAIGRAIEQDGVLDKFPLLAGSLSLSLS
eukprot:COSAG03_NODE_26956_length_256_cov_0.643312_1_plen_47_part_10